MRKCIITILIITFLLAVYVARIATEVEQLKYEVHMLQKIVGGE